LHHLSYPSRRLDGVLVLPDLDHLPAGLGQQARGLAVAILRPSDLRAPPLAIVLWLAAMFWAAVPEASVQVNRDSDSWEDNVGAPATEGSYRLALDEEPKTRGVKRGPKPPLRNAIPPRVGGEPPANFLVQRFRCALDRHS